MKVLSNQLKIYTDTTTLVETFLIYPTVLRTEELSQQASAYLCEKKEKLSLFK